MAEECDNHDGDDDDAAEEEEEDEDQEEDEEDEDEDDDNDEYHWHWNYNYPSGRFPRPAKVTTFHFHPFSAFVTGLWRLCHQAGFFWRRLMLTIWLFNIAMENHHF